MKRQVLGLDINDEFVAATVVEMQGQDMVVTASGFASFKDQGGLTEILPDLLATLKWKGGTCVTGMTLADVSLRNLSIPFTESRKIAQILPLELEDQLLTPVRKQLVEYSVNRVEESQSHLLVTTVAKETIEQELKQLADCKVIPEILTLRTLVLAEQLSRQSGKPGSYLLVEAGLHVANIAIVVQGQVVFLRRIAYSDRMFTSHPFIYEDNAPGIANFDEAMECITALCEDIRVSQGLFHLESRMEIDPDYIVLSGILAQIPEVKEKMEAEFGSEILLGDLQKHSKVSLGPGPRTTWSPFLYDHALALALQGIKKKPTVNFRKDEFALPKLYLATRNQLAAAAIVVITVLAGIFIYLGFDYKGMKSRYDDLNDEILAIYKGTFPEMTRINRAEVALVDMNVKLRNVKAPSIATPIFSGDKRALTILADISGRIPPSVEIDVARLVIDKETITIKGTTDSFNNVNLIQNVLRKSPAYDDVDIVSAAADKDSGSIRFELKLQTAKAS